MSNVFRLLKNIKKNLFLLVVRMSNMDFSSYGTLKDLGRFNKFRLNLC